MHLRAAQLAAALLLLVDVSLRLAQLVNEVELYKVLGGGWKKES